MTASNHMLAGAVVAAALRQPIIVFPAAFLSHFLLDVLPHFGIHELEPSKRNKHPLFKYIIAIDVVLGLCLTIFLPTILKGVVSRWVLILGMVLAWVPDLMWIRGFLSGLYNRTTFVHDSWVSRFHQRIQWFEKPWGLITEVIWFGAMTTLLGILAA